MLLPERFRFLARRLLRGASLLLAVDRDYLVMAKPIGPRCNLSCSYCYYLCKDSLFTSEHPGRMPDALLESYIRQRLHGSPNAVTSFEWHGGEPTLLGIDFFRRVVEFQKKYAPAGRKIINGLQTNGTLINENWAEFLASEKFTVGLSLDGPADVHDVFRRTKANQPTHASVVRAFRLLQRNNVHCDILCVVHSSNVNKPLSVYRYFKELGARYIQFLPLVEPAPDTPTGVSVRTARSQAIGNFYTTIFDEWIRNDLGRMSVQLFDEALRPACKLPHALCIFSETCGTVPVLEHDGRMFCCDHFVKPDFCLGNLNDAGLDDIFRSSALVLFGLNKRDNLPAYCKQCDVLAWCNGGCPKDRIAVSPDGEKGLNYLCPAFRQFFAHSRPTMERLAVYWQSGKPLEKFSEELRPKKAIDVASVGRNDACPCGSGKKYKKCCFGK